MNRGEQLKDVKFDMHFHSTRSDGHNTSDEILNTAKEKWLELIALLDHDIVSSQDFIDWARDRWIYTLYSSELSVRKSNKKWSMHFWYYASDISEKVEIILEGAREGSLLMIESQINKLHSIWFDVTIEDFYDFLKRQRKNKYSGNKYTLAVYLFQSSHNQKLVEKILWRVPTVTDFYLNCLKKRWKKTMIFLCLSLSMNHHLKYFEK